MSVNAPDDTSIVTYLSASQNVVTRQVEYIHDKLWNSVTADPKEHCLSIFDQVQAMPFQSFRCQRQSRRHDDSVFAYCSGLVMLVSERKYANRITLHLEACYADNRKKDIYRGLEAEMAKTKVELERRREYPGGFGHFDEYQPIGLIFRNRKSEKTIWTYVFEQT